MSDSETLSVNQHSLNGQAYGFSAADFSELGSNEQTLVTIAVDESGSTSSFKKNMEAAIKSIAEALKRNPRADSLMVRLIAFDDQMREVHGFVPLSSIDPATYDNCLAGGGSTLLFDTIVNAVTATAALGHDLYEADYDCNGCIYIITDGMDNESRFGADRIAEELENIARQEQGLESLQTFLIGVGTGRYADVQQYLDQLKNDGKLTEYIDIKDATPDQLAKLGGWISSSVSSQSQALGSGGPSQVLAF